jgi:hypothetical protein
MQVIPQKAVCSTFFGKDLGPDIDADAGAP